MYGHTQLTYIWSMHAFWLTKISYENSLMCGLILKYVYLLCMFIIAKRKIRRSKKQASNKIKSSAI